MLTNIKRWMTARPYLSAGLVFLGLAVIGLKLFGWWKAELQQLLLLYVIALLGIRLDEISRRIGTAAPTAANPHADESATILARLDEIARALKRLDHRLAKLAAARQPQPSVPAEAEKPPPPEMPEA